MKSADDYRLLNETAGMFTTPAHGYDFHYRGGAGVTREELAEVGLTPADVPNLTIIDKKGKSND